MLNMGFMSNHACSDNKGTYINIAHHIHIISFPIRSFVNVLFSLWGLLLVLLLFQRFDIKRLLIRITIETFQHHYVTL